MPTSAWGIDIGNRALKAVKLVREGDALRVDDFEIIEHEHILSNAGDNKESLIEASLASFIQRHPYRGEPTAIGVGGQQSFARFIKLPPVEEKKIPEIVRFEAIQQIPFPLEDVEWSYQLFRDEQSPDVEVGIFAMRKELINRHISFFTHVNLNVQVVQMNPLAVYNAMYYDKRIEGATMIIDVGAENTDLIIAEGEQIWMRSIPVGGNNFTEALVKSFKLNFAKAEDLKRTAATSKYARQIFQAMRPVFADLVAEVQRSIGFYASVHRESRLKKIIALGGTFRLPGLQKYLQQNLQLEVERLDGLTAGAPQDAKLATSFNENLLSSISAYGLAIQAMEDAKITSSLLPLAIRREKLWKEKTKWFAAAAALFVLGTGVGFASYFTNRWAYQANEGLRSETATVTKQAQDLDSKWASIEQAGSQDRQLITNIASIGNYRTLWGELLSDIHRALPQQRFPELLSNDRDKVKTIPRDKRELIIVESISSAYQSDMAAALNTPDFKSLADSGGMSSGGAGGFFGGGGGGGPAPHGGPPVPGMTPGAGGAPGPQRGPQATAAAAPAGPTNPNGFIITLKCTTPNSAGADFVEQTFLKALDKIRPAPGKYKPYAVQKATIASNQKIASNETRLSAMRNAYAASKPAAGKPQEQQRQLPGLDQRLTNVPPPPGTGVRPDGNAPAAAAGENSDAPFRDRLTDEDMRQDWEFTIVFAVTLDPPPAAAPAAPPGPQAAVNQP